MKHQPPPSPAYKGLDHFPALPNDIERDNGVQIPGIPAVAYAQLDDSVHDKNILPERILVSDVHAMFDFRERDPRNL